MNTGPTRSSGYDRSAVSPAHRSGRKRRSLEPLPPCAPQHWAGERFRPLGEVVAHHQDVAITTPCLLQGSIATRWKG
ncbi:NADH-quinone oxidoreductase, E subunit [Trichinella spiralis]|uniref:NADH-quinone oxidoreductase, E subunit n=1 Tax=Trichinella spiralis TaxID=6334 RepID=UPI0001EFCE9F|nr:NADH-quinone oxidoreductase, E subunit [Trichinella spiralis]